MRTQKLHLTALALVAAFTLAACDKPNSAEKAGAEMGREIDQAAAKTQDKINEASAKTQDKINEASAKTQVKMQEASAKLGEQAAKTEVAIEDSTVTAKIKSAIVAEPGLKVMDINVDTIGGVVTLNGIVDTPAKSERVAQIARGVSGARQVNNRLIVRTPG